MVICSPLLSREEYLEYLQHELHRKEKELLDVGREDDKSEVSKGDTSEHQVLKNAILKSFRKILGGNTDSGLDIGSEDWEGEESLSGSSQDGRQGSQDLKSQPSHSEKKTSKNEADFESALAAIMANLMGETTQQQQSIEGKTHAIPKSISDNFETDDETGMDSHDETLREQIPTQQTPWSQSSDSTKWESDRDLTVDSAKDGDFDFDEDFDEDDFDDEDFDEEDFDEDFDLDDLSLDEWDEETLREVEEEVEDALQEQLTEAGQGIIFNQVEMARPNLQVDAIYSA